MKYDFAMAAYADLMEPDANPLETTFELNDTLYAKANIHQTDEVYLWLGVSSMPQHGLPCGPALLLMAHMTDMNRRT